MERVDARARAALVELLVRRREVLTAGAEHVGWKLGVGDRERIEGSIAIGYLTTATTLPTAATFRSGGLVGELRADVELAVELGRDVLPAEDTASARGAIRGVAVALEIVDLAPVLRDPVSVVATNVFHRAVAFAAMRSSLPEPPLRATASVNGELRCARDAEDELGARLAAAARVLAAVGERLRAGDRIISGSIVQVPIAAGDRVRGEIAGLGAAELETAD